MFDAEIKLSVSLNYNSGLLLQLSPLPLTKGLVAPWDAVAQHLCFHTWIHCSFSSGDPAVFYQIFSKAPIYLSELFLQIHLSRCTDTSEQDVPRITATSKGAKQVGTESSTHYLCSKGVCLLLAVQARGGREVSLEKL